MKFDKSSHMSDIDFEVRSWIILRGGYVRIEVISLWQF